MLRWRQSTRHTLDGHGRSYASTLRHHSSPSNIAAITKPTRQKTRHSVSDKDAKNGKRLATPTLGITAELNKRTARPSTSPSQIVHRSHVLLSSLEVRQKSFEGGANAVFPSSAPNTSQVAPTVGAVAAKDLAYTRTPSSSNSSSGNATNCRIICGIAKLLSPRSRALNRSVPALIELYKKASSDRSSLTQLDAALLSDLLNLCGTLSLSSETRCIYDSPLVSYFHRASLDPSGLPAFVLEVGDDMERLGLGLSPGNRYWILRANVALGERTGGKKLDPVQRRRFLIAARTQYQHLKGITDIPEIHLSYLLFLLASNTTQHLQEAVNNLCNMLEVIVDPHSQIAEMLWDVVALRGSHISPESKARICDIALQRINLGAACVPAVHGLKHSRSSPTSAATQGFQLQDVVNISHLSIAYASTLFPFYNKRYPSTSLRNWALSLAREALAHQLPLDIRWNNLVLLAVSMSPKDVSVNYQPSSTTSPNSNNSLWRTALILESLNKRMMHGAPDIDIEAHRDSVKNVARPVWRMFTTAAISDQPVTVNRAYATMFLYLAAASCDNELKDRCYDFCLQYGLWVYQDSDPRGTQMQAVDTIVAFCAAFVACKWQDWTRLHSIIAAVVPGSSWQTDVTSGLIQHYLADNVDIAFNVFLHARQNRVGIPESTLRTLSLALVKQERWRAIPLFLDEVSFSRDHVEQVLSAVMRVFEERRYEQADAALMKILSRLACRLYANERPPQALKHPMRYFLSMMIWTHNARAVVKLIASLKKSASDIYDMRLVQRLVIQLAQRRQYSSALKVYRMFEGENVALDRALGDIRSKLALKLSRSGAHALVRNLFRRGRNRRLPFSRSDALVRAVSSRKDPSLPLYYAQVRPIIGEAAAEPSAIRHAISVLVKGRRIYAARKLYAKSQTKLDPKMSTTIGNIILHGPMSGGSLRNGRLVRNILRTKDRLAKECGFIPDRTTTNIILKALLRWNAMIDAKRVRRLFDQMVHEGYPVPERWRRQHGVPFDSPRGASNGFNMPSLPPHINFTKHVRPMYKMFIKAFYLRKDAAAARVIVGILKEVQAEDLQEKEKRNRARRQGVIKKRMKEIAAKGGKERGDRVLP